MSGRCDRSKWKLVRLGSSCSIKARIGWQGLKTTEYLDNGHYGLISGTDFKDGFVDWKSCAYVSEWRYKQDSNIQARNGDLLITKDGTIGKVAYVCNLPCPATLNSGVFVIRPKIKGLTPEFLQLIFKSRFFNEFLDRITSGSTIVHLYQKDIVDFDFPIPEESEQLSIAHSIAAVDLAIQRVQSLIDKYEAIKKATVNLLLKSTEEDSVVFLSDVCNVSTGPFGTMIHKADYVVNGIPIVNPMHIIGDKIVPSTDALISIDAAKKLSRYSLKKDMVVLGRRGEMGRCALITDKEDGWLCGTGSFYISCSNRIEPSYLVLILSSPSAISHFIGDSVGTTMINLNNSVLRSLTFHLPTISKQRTIVSRISRIQRLITENSKQLNKLISIKQGLMSYFFG